MLGCAAWPADCPRPIAADAVEPLTESNSCGASTTAAFAAMHGRQLAPRAIWARCAQAGGARLGCLANVLAEHDLPMRGTRATIDAGAWQHPLPAMVIRTVRGRPHYVLIAGRCGDRLVLWDPNTGAEHVDARRWLEGFTTGSTPALWRMPDRR